MRWEEEGRRDFLAVFIPISVAPATEDSFLSQLQLCPFSPGSCAPAAWHPTEKSDSQLCGGPPELLGSSVPLALGWQLLPVVINIWTASVSTFCFFSL